MINLLARIRRFVAPPVFENDEEKTRIASLLNTILWSQVGLLVAINILFSFVGLFSGRPPQNLAISVVAIAMFCAMLLLVHRGFAQGISYLLAFSITGIITYSIAQSASVSPATLSGLLIPVMMAGLFAGWRGTVVVTTVNMVALSSLGYFYEQGWVASPPLTTSDLISFGAISFTSALLLTMASKSIQEALLRARRHQKELSALAQSLEQHVADRTKALETSAEVSRRLTAILDPHQLANEVVSQVQAAFDHYYAQIYLFDETGENLILAAGTGEAGVEMMKRGHSLVKGRGLVGRAAERNETILVPDTSQDSGWLPNELLPETRAEAAIPISLGDRVLGVLDVQDQVRNDITAEDITLLESLASQVAISLQNADSYARAEAALQEARSLLENAPEAVMIVDLGTGLFVEPNENAVKLYGLPREELLKVGPVHVSPPLQPDGRGSTESAMEKIGEAMQGKTPVFEWMHRNAQGRDIPCEVRLVRMPGERPRVRASVTDITERQLLQALTSQRARQQEAINLITQRIQAATTIEEAMQVAARELGHALGKRQTLVALEPDALIRDRNNAS